MTDITKGYIDYNDTFVPDWKKDVWHRVELGSNWLDCLDHDWYTSIDPVLLDMSDGSACVCGQVFEKLAGSQQGFNYFVHNYGGEGQAVAYGFLAGGYEWTDKDDIVRFVSSEEEYSALAEEWLHVVAKRLANDGLNIVRDPIH